MVCMRWEKPVWPYNTEFTVYTEANVPMQCQLAQKCNGIRPFPLPLFLPLNVYIYITPSLLSELKPGNNASYPAENCNDIRPLEAG